MRLDQSHRGWAFVSAAILAAAIAAYIPYSLLYPGGPSGNTWPGLIYGVLGYGMMLFAGLMGARKKVPLWRIGRAKVWMRGHLWLGALALPMILFHAAFAARGPLTLVMLILLFTVVLSGISGAAIQHYLPSQMMTDVPLETIYEQIPHVREQLREEAAAILDRILQEPDSGPRLSSAPEKGRIAVLETEKELPAIGLSAAEQVRFKIVFNNGILPFLREPEGDSPLGNPGKASSYFEALRRQYPPAMHEPLKDLESICEEQRQLSRQRRLYFVLHGWLLVHVPLSITLLVLGAIHAAISIRY